MIPRQGWGWGPVKQGVPAILFLAIGLLAAPLVALTWLDDAYAIRLDWFLLFGIIGVATELRHLDLPRADWISPISVVVLAALWMQGPLTAMFVLFLGVMKRAVIHRAWDIGAAFQLGLMFTAVVVSWIGFRLAGGDLEVPLTEGPPAAYLISAIAFLVLKVLGAAVITVGRQGHSFAGNALALFRDQAPGNFWILVAAAVLAEATFRLGWPALFLFMAILLVRDGIQRRLARTRFQRAVRRMAAYFPRRTVCRRHAERMLSYAELFGAHYGLPERELRDLRFAALLHDMDLGDIPIAGKLDLQQWKNVLAHPLKASKRLAETKILAGVAANVRHHHERWDGRGYPDGLQGRMIPLGARILAILEVFDALATGRGYRQPVGLKEALTEIERVAGSQLDPTLARMFCDFVLQHEEKVLAILRGEASWNRRKGRGREAADPLERIPLLMDAAYEGFALRESMLTDVWRRLKQAFQRSQEPVGDFRSVRAVHEVAQEFRGTLNEEKIKEILVVSLARQLRGRVWLTTRDTSRRHLITMVDEQENIRRFTTEALPQPEVRAFYEEQPVQQSVDIQPSDTDAFLPPGKWTVLSVPFRLRRRLLGILNVAREGGEPFSEDEASLMGLIVLQAALAVENARLNRELRERLQQVSSLKRFTDQLLDSLPLPVFTFGADGYPRVLNEKARNILGEITGKIGRLEQLPLRVWRRLDVRFAWLEEALMTGEDRVFEGVEFGSGPGARQFDVWIRPVRDRGGATTAVIAVAWETTEKRKLEGRLREGERMAALGEMAAGMVHEVRNPLTAIKGFIQLMPEPLDGGMSMREMILGEIEQIERLLNDLLLIGRSSRPRRVLCRLNRLVEEAFILLEPQAKSVRAIMEIVLDRTDPQAWVDPYQIRQVLFNLGKNAIEAVRSGGWIRLETHRSPDGREVWLQISDNGEGIPEDQLPRLFEPFYTTKAEGSGLGLPVVRSIVHSHGGEIDVASVPGKGTKFTIRLAIGDPASPPEDTPEIEDAGAAVPATQRSV